MKQIKLFLCTLLAMLMLLPTGAYALTIHTVTSTFNGMDVCRDQEMEPNRYAELYTVEGVPWMCRSNAVFEQKTINGSFAIGAEWSSPIIIHTIFNKEGFHVEGYVRNVTVRAGGNVEKIEVTYWGPDARDVVIGTITPTSREVTDYEFTVGYDYSAVTCFAVGEYSTDGVLYVTFTPREDKDADIIVESIKFDYSEERPEGVLSGVCGPDLNWKIDHDVLTVSGKGMMYDYGKKYGKKSYLTTAPWREYYDRFSKVVLEEGVTILGDDAFCGCPINEIVLPEGLLRIGAGALSITNIESVTIPSTVEEIQRIVFEECSSLKSIIVNENNQWYDSRDNCNAIIKTATNELVTGCQTTVIPDGIVTIGDEAFSECRELTEITIPNSVTTIGSEAFDACTGLTELVIPDNVTTIGSLAFFFCRGVVTMTIGSGVTKIGERAFNYMYSLKDVVCTADPANLTWEGYDDESGFNTSELTKFHVADPEAWKAKFPNAHVQFVAIGSAETVEGDVSGDGKTDAEDVVALMNYIAGMTAGISATAADVNKDGKVDVSDIVALVNLIHAL